MITGEEFVTPLNTAWSRGTMLAAHGTLADEAATAAAIVVRAETVPQARRAVTRSSIVRAETVPPARRAVTSPMRATNQSAELRPEAFPLPLQLSVNLTRNTDRESLTAEAPIVHRGHNTLVIEVRIVDDRQRLIVKLVATQLAPVAPTVTAPAARPGR